MSLLIVGTYTVLSMSQFQNFLEIPSQHPRADLRAGHRAPFKPAQHSEHRERDMEIPASLSDWQVCLAALIGQGILAFLELNFASCLGTVLFQIPGVICIPLAFE